ncbi:hypothetical protein BDN72DRAFT_493628 [Pluteus cervinus]|uniref:Uncharacterized protein n=1 Tax=Pluteus cervinus TaxID=181527 RepID=A0ACD3B0A6_9AGAR|nr:hypothetical protein BDN72DRAFT_493628 [Pluteus cervinus]
MRARPAQKKRLAHVVAGSLMSRRVETLAEISRSQSGLVSIPPHFPCHRRRTEGAAVRITCYCLTAQISPSRDQITR